MEPWLLGLGALVLIALTVWIVWPARLHEETPTMNNEPQSSLPPQGDRFEDQYTSATGDLSAGGVAEALESMQEDEKRARQTESMPEPVGSAAPEPVAPAAPAREPVAFQQDPVFQPHAYPPSALEPTPSAPAAMVPVGGIVFIGAIVAAIWLYVRWQRERNRPINRLRRGARDVTQRIGSRLPDPDDLPEGTAPVGGAAALLSTLLVARALRSRAAEDEDAEQRETQSQQQLGRAAARAVAAWMAEMVAVKAAQRLAERGLDATSDARKALAERGAEGIDSARQQRTRAAKNAQQFGKRAGHVGKNADEVRKSAMDLVEDADVRTSVMALLKGATRRGQSAIELGKDADVRKSAKDFVKDARRRGQSAMDLAEDADVRKGAMDFLKDARHRSQSAADLGKNAKDVRKSAKDLLKDARHRGRDARDLAQTRAKKPFLRVGARGLVGLMAGTYLVRRVLRDRS